MILSIVHGPDAATYGHRGSPRNAQARNAPGSLSAYPELIMVACAVCDIAIYRQLPN